MGAHREGGDSNADHHSHGAGDDNLAGVFGVHIEILSLVTDALKLRAEELTRRCPSALTSAVSGDALPPVPPLEAAPQPFRERPGAQRRVEHRLAREPGNAP